MNKQHILDEIQRVTRVNGGRPLGRARFEKETGIKVADWQGKYWARWNDAIREAGFKPNELIAAHDEQYLLRKVAELAVELGRFPVASEMRLKRRHDPEFPNDKTFYSRFGNKTQLAQAIMDYCSTQPDLSTVIDLCRQFTNSEVVHDDDDGEDNEVEEGYVYLALMKVGKEKRYKIGKADVVGARTRQIAVSLPENLELMHAIATDDAYGIETYWHKRFEHKRRGGEWFVLSAADVKAFRRRKFM